MSFQLEYASAMLCYENKQTVILNKKKCLIGGPKVTMVTTYPETILEDLSSQMNNCLLVVA